MNKAQDWKDYISKGKNKTSRPIANNTTVRLVEGGVAIKLHNTDIVTMLDNGKTILSSGGWRTHTTKERLNEYTRSGISQKLGVWYMRDKSLFYDGIELDINGDVIKPQNTEKYEKELIKIKKRAKTYAHNFALALEAGKVDFPSGGDCWYCLMLQGVNNDRHIIDHMDKSYFVPSLLVNAAKASGYQDYQIGLMGIGKQKMMFSVKDVERIIYKYVVKELQKNL